MVSKIICAEVTVHSVGWRSWVYCQWCEPVLSASNLRKDVLLLCIILPSDDNTMVVIFTQNRVYKKRKTSTMDFEKNQKTKKKHINNHDNSRQKKIKNLSRVNSTQTLIKLSGEKSKHFWTGKNNKHDNIVNQCPVLRLNQIFYSHYWKIKSILTAVVNDFLLSANLVNV